MPSPALARGPQLDWKVTFRRSLRRALQLIGAGGLALAMLFLAIALVSFTQTDASVSTAASGNDIQNWMGAPGAWAAERVLFLFGIPSILL